MGTSEVDTDQKDPYSNCCSGRDVRCDSRLLRIRESLSTLTTNNCSPPPV